MKRRGLALLLAFNLSASLVAPLYAAETVESWQLEAEDYKLVGTQVAKDTLGYSGTGYVTGFDTSGDCVEFNFDSSMAGSYILKIGYSAPYGSKINDVYVNGTKQVEVKFAETNEFKEVEAGVIKLKEGTNTITFQNSWGWMFLDYIKIEPASAISIPTDIPDTLINPSATENAKKVMTYLTSHYGKQILAGQFAYSQDYKEIQAVYNATGKYPAIIGLDFMDYSPHRVQEGALKGTDTDKAISWWKEGGLSTFCWHWSAPKGVDPNNKWGGFYTKNTTFDYSIGLADHSSEEYQLMIRDIDAIAVQLKKLDEAGVPVLWRPLHEAAGGWFWWGTKGSENYKELWKLMYDRLVNYHGLNNLIWIWSAGDATWYPGDDYVDVIGEDIYTTKHNYDSQINKFLEVLKYTNGRKLITLSENGVLTDPDALIADYIPWSWNCTWGGEFVINGSTQYVDTYTEADMLKKYYTHDYVITRDELPTSLFENGENPPIEAMEVAITSITEGQLFDCTTEATAINLQAEVKNAQGTTVEFFVNNTSVGTGETVAWTPTGLSSKPDGIETYTIVAKATDAEGKTVSSRPISIKVKLPISNPGGGEEEDKDKVISVVKTPSSATGNEIGINLQITNLGDSMDLSKLAVRYYYSEEGVAPQKFNCYHAALQMNVSPWYVTCTDKCKGEVVQRSEQTADATHYVEIKFDGNQTYEKDAKLLLQSCVTKTDWSNYDQTNDFSYNKDLVVYYDGAIIYGMEP